MACVGVILFQVCLIAGAPWGRLAQRGFNAQERATLSWAEALTLLAGSGVSDADYNAAHAELIEQELAALTVAIGTMNLWNRIGVGAQIPA